MMNATSVTPERIMQFAWGYVPPLVLEAAIRHRVFDVLDAGPKTVKETAAATGASERGLRTIMNVLVGLNFLAKGSGGRYVLTPESETFLVSTKRGFQGGILKHASAQLIPKWLHLNEIVGTGSPAVAVNEEGTGSDFFQKFVVDIFPMSYPSALALADQIAANGPLAIEATKRLMRAAAERPPEEVWALQAELQPEVFGSDDAREGATAFVQRRRPVWRGR